MTVSSVAIISGPSLAAYNFGEDHVFGPFRHQAFIDGMKEQGLTERVTWLPPVQCTIDDLRLFHNSELIESVRQASKFGIGYLDQGDTPARMGIFEAASTVAGSVLDIIDRIMAGQYRRGFVPIAGLHHSYRDHVSGFCVFNDCAIAIEHIRKCYPLKKILYVDIDAHHGDGVFYSYDSDSDVFIVDFHEDGRFLYPGTGDADETGSGPAKGTKMNVPMSKHGDDVEFAQNWGKAEVFIREIRPEFIIFQCGADSLKGDPITHLEYTTRSHQLAAESLCRLADEYCEGRLVALGGGGYNLENISQAWPVVVRAML
jgi:acetoin utilization protein AcuC